MPGITYLTPTSNPLPYRYSPIPRELPGTLLDNTCTFLGYWFYTGSSVGSVWGSSSIGVGVYGGNALDTPLDTYLYPTIPFLPSLTQPTPPLPVRGYLLDIERELSLRGFPLRG